MKPVGKTDNCIRTFFHMLVKMAIFVGIQMRKSVFV